MKTIIENSTNISKYIFEDNVELSLESDRINTPNFIIGDMNSSNSTVLESVEPPSDWIGGKYTYSDSTWALNPDWIEPPE